jgi:hypothetical protein
MVAKRFLDILLSRQTSLSGLGLGRGGSGHALHGGGGGVSYKSSYIAITSVAWEKLEALSRLCELSSEFKAFSWTGSVPPGLSGSGQEHGFGVGIFSGLHAHMPFESLLESTFSQARGHGISTGGFDEDYAEEMRVNASVSLAALPSLVGSFAVSDESLGALPHIGVLSAQHLLSSPPTKPSALHPLQSQQSQQATAVMASLEGLAISNDDDPDEI